MSYFIEKNSKEEWVLSLSQYKGDITAEEFAVKHNIVAINDNQGGLGYQFVGSEENVKNALDFYLKIR